MPQRKKDTPQQIKLSDEQRDQIAQSIQSYFLDQFDEEVSYFKARNLLEFFLTEIGAPVYNQAIQQATRFMADKLNDMEANLHEPEQPYSNR